VTTSRYFGLGPPPGEPLRKSIIHPTDVGLLRLIHGEVSLDTLGATLAHLHQCSACARALADIQEQECEVATLLSALDHGIPELPDIPARPLKSRFHLRAWLARTFGAEVHQAISFAPDH
jgi:anti-sigma factor RsiW